MTESKSVPMIEGWVTESCFCVGGMESRKEGRMDEAMDTALVQSSRDSSPKRNKASRTARVYIVFLLSLTPPHKCVCVTCVECVF